MPQRREFLAVLLLLSAFLAVCFAVQSRYVPWNDEVQFVDPAANLYYQAGFVSTEWSNQTDRTLWCGNAPVYPILVYLTFLAFHFGQPALRVLNWLIMAGAVFTLWRAVAQLDILKRARTRLLLLVLTLCAAGGYSCYANLRYDGLCFLECSLVLLALSLSAPRARNAALLALGAALILTNFQLPQYILLLAILVSIVLALRLTLARKLICLFLGMAGGAGALLIFYWKTGALDAFRLTLRQQAGQGLVEKAQHLPYYFQFDSGLVALLAVLLAALFWTKRPDLKLARSAIGIGILSATVIPIFFLLTRRFVFSSAWMVLVPEAMAVCYLFEAGIFAAPRRRAFVLACCAIAMASGLPRALAGILNEWSIRDYAPVQAFVSGSIGRNDVAFCDPSAYFAAKPRAMRLYGPGYLEVMNAEEKQALTVVLVDPADQEQTLAQLGGSWTPISLLDRNSTKATALLPFRSGFRCRLQVLRRATQPSIRLAASGGQRSLISH